MSYEHKMLSFIRKVFELSKTFKTIHGPDYEKEVKICNESWTILISNYSTYNHNETIYLIHSSISNKKILTFINPPWKDELRIKNSLIELTYSKDIITMDDIQYVLTHGRIKDLIDGTILSFFEEYDQIMSGINSIIDTLKDNYDL